jgi:CRISPR/Cas system Type II protein with McrA/HNH and RuvC-like nuclease domain
MDTVLVLNSDYSPLNVVPLIRGFILVNKGKAEVIKKGESEIVTTVGNFVRPIIIRLINFVRFRPKNLRVNRKRIFARDGHKCAYCLSTKNLSIDHVVPKSRGGKNTWENMVTSCKRCNGIKDDRTPDEANMKLLLKPYQPNLFSVVVSEHVDKIWKEFSEEFFYTN